jgi:hypothetical protein
MPAIAAESSITRTGREVSSCIAVFPEPTVTCLIQI